MGLLLRIFTVFEVFRDLFVMFVISMKAASDLILIICCFIYMFAHLGVDLFSNELGDELGKNVNFNTPENALCVLMQMFVGEGWNEILSLTVQQTQASAALYFCTFVLGSVLFTQAFVSVVLNMYSRITADNMRLVHSISGKQARSLLDEDEDEDEGVSLSETQAKAGNAQLPLVELGTVQPPNTARQSVGTVLGMESSALHN